jgi:hypothetical protein
MSAATSLLIVLLSNQGHWFGEREYLIWLQWVAPAHAVDAVLEWRLMAGEVQLATDRVAMAVGERETTVRLTPPRVRARTAVHWTYRLIRRADGGELESGSRVLTLYPANLLGTVKKQIEAKAFFLLDAGGDLAGVLSESGIQHNRVTEMGQLRFARADLIIIAPDQIGESPFEQSVLLDQARAGASVGLFQQPRAGLLGGYSVARRALPKEFTWRLDHPLLAGLDAADLRTLLEGKDQTLSIQIPADEPALEIAWWPREVPGDQPVPIDAVMLTKRIGEGRLVLAQLPLGSWKSDPRSQQLLANMLGYLATRPEPTPPPSRREVPQRPATAPVPTITIPPGGVP